MDDLTDPSTELANLNAENDERLGRIVEQGVPLQPGLFESLRVIIYLETLLSVVDKLDEANLEFANKASGILDQLEQAVRQRAITGGIVPFYQGGLQPGDIDKIVTAGRHGRG